MEAAEEAAKRAEYARLLLQDLVDECRMRLQPDAQRERLWQLELSWQAQSAQASGGCSIDPAVTHIIGTKLREVMGALNTCKCLYKWKFNTKFNSVVGTKKLLALQRLVA